MFFCLALAFFLLKTHPTRCEPLTCIAGNPLPQFMFGPLSSNNHANDDNMFLYYENLGDDNMHLHLVRIFKKEGKVEFKEETVF